MQIVPLRLYFLASGAATTDAAAQLTIPRDGMISGINFNISYGSNAGADALIRAQLSWSSVNSLSTNDAQGVLGDFALKLVLDGTATSFSKASECWQIPDLAIPAFAGSRLYLHVTSAVANDLFTANVYLQIPSR